MVDAGIDCANLASVCASAAVIPSAALSLARDTQVAWLHAGSGVCSPEDLLYPVSNLISTMPLIPSSVVIGDITYRRGVPRCRCGPDGQNSDEARGLEEDVGELHGVFCFLVQVVLVKLLMDDG